MVRGLLGGFDSQPMVGIGFVKADVHGYAHPPGSCGLQRRLTRAPLGASSRSQWSLASWPSPRAQICVGRRQGGRFVRLLIVGSNASCYGPPSCMKVHKLIPLVRALELQG